jgi:2-polyprenyl-6-methoxyphenol hydroxylase-like FAD-dependent oxidoreductase
MPIVERALVVGGGIGGMAAALCLRRLGAHVDLIEIDPAWKVYGAGIHLVGAALRAFDDLGLLPQLREHGCVNGDVHLYPMNGVGGVRQHAASDAPIEQAAGIMRPALHGVLSAATRGAGVHVQLGVKLSELHEHARAVTVVRSDGNRADYDLVVAADGVSSQLRHMLFPDAPTPAFTSQGCWRLVAERPADLECTTLYVGGPHALGFIPVSQAKMYMFLLQTRSDNQRVDPAEESAQLRQLLSGYGGIAATVRDNIGAQSSIVYRPLESLLMPRPWYRGRVLLLGDAAHTTTSQLAMGAGLAVEDALVLGQELSKAVDLPTALAAYEERRFERCRMVVENAAQIGRYQREGAPPEKAFSLVLTSMAQLALPY